MKTEIAIRFTFDAAHSLPMLPEGHKCKRLHGHTYHVRLYLKGTVRGDGMIVDYDEVAAKVVAPLMALIDHRHLNEIAGLQTPTTEVLASWLFTKASESIDHRFGAPSARGGWWWLSRVRVYESRDTFAEVSP